MINTRVVVRVAINPATIAGAVRSKDVQDLVDILAEAVLTQQRTLVPVDTGKLSKSLGIRKSDDGIGRQVGSFGVDYAAPVEAGHQQGKTFVPAQPFIRPSLDAVRRRLQNG